VDNRKFKNESCNCLICGHSSNVLFNAKVMYRYDVTYFNCPDCGFIYTETPYWLPEAYAHAITSLDVGLVKRNLDLAEITEKIIQRHFNSDSRFIDYAGGYGLFVRLMRDKGYDFIRQDEYCENIFALNHDVRDLTESTEFELATAFEVFEHLSDPTQTVNRILSYCESVLFTTEIAPIVRMSQPSDWWYFSAETGQHISFYSLKSLQLLADKLRCSLYSNNRYLHLLTRRKFRTNPFDKNRWERLQRWVGKLKGRSTLKRKSLIGADHELAQKKAANGRST
jgi:2-polyprenyl-3-methyl-5-hydroxy-6-metoxy-1,4-benzoquinol methylase